MEPCRHCGTETKLVLNLGNQPIANALQASASEPEQTYPLHFMNCHSCGLYQATTLQPDKIFGAQYPYMTSVAKTYVNQCNEWAQKLLTKLTPKRVLEIGCNDGHLLQNFKNFDHLGIDPSSSVTYLAKQNGINIETEYWSLETATKYATEKKFDLIIANNVLAHTPNLNDFVEGVYFALDPEGVFVFEVPYVKTLLDATQFDTIYHEHYSYFSKSTLIKIFSAHKLKIFHFEDIPTHGGSLRVYAGHLENTSAPTIAHVEDEKISHENFSKTAQMMKFQWLHGLAELKMKGKQIVAFGAAAKGTVFCNYIGIDSDFIDYCVDESPLKQHKFTPGTRIPIKPLETINETKPDIIVILPWNFRKEIEEKLSFAKSWNAKFISRAENG